MTRLLSFTGGDTEAAEFIEALITIAHCWDDVVDEGGVDRRRMDRMMLTALIGLPRNRFYRAHMDDLLPLMEAGIVGWQVATDYELAKDEHGIELAHGLRYSILQAAIFTVMRTNTYDGARAVLPELTKILCPERLNDYLKEHGHGA